MYKYIIKKGYRNMNKYNNKCIYCNFEIDNDDNFCSQCGHWTPKGYTFLNSESNVNTILNGDIIKQKKRFNQLVKVFIISIILFFVFYTIQGNDLFKPIAFLKKQITNYAYGYKTSTIKTDNKYLNQKIDTYDDALKFIKNDFITQKWLCSKDTETFQAEYKIENDYNIASVCFCDIEYDEVKRITSVIDKMYILFPKIKSGLTNITITNAKTASEYIAYFQPLYQFVNINSNINEFNKINKTQILLNSYYFLNSEYTDKSINNIVEQGWYVSDATLESTIAHELGHFISFKLLLKEHNLDNITLVTSSNEKEINNIINIFNSGAYSYDILVKALDNYNKKYNYNLSLEEFTHQFGHIFT